MLRSLSRLFYPNQWKMIKPQLTPVCQFHCSQINFSEKEIFPEANEPSIPAYEEKFDEPLNIKRARLFYQSRKRGVSENGVLLATFADKNLPNMNENQLNQYDRLINLPSNDWDIYYWITQTRPTPTEFDNEVMEMLKEHVKNKNKDSRQRQPDNILVFT